MFERALSADAASRVSASRIGWLTTLRPDGSPHTTPVWFVFDEDAIWIATGRRNVKAANVRSDPRVSIAVDGSADAPLVAEGKAELMDVAATDHAVVAAFAEKYNGWDIADEAVDGPRVVVKVTVSRWLLAG
jgi:PPOX class probable F420-dependent enzyme